jgi:hypothetical protein
MKRMIWVNKSDSFDAANEFDDDYYLSMSREERLETLQFLREIYFKIKKGSEDESRKGLRRVIKIIE